MVSKVCSLEFTTSRVNCDEIAGDGLRQFANRNCYRLSIETVFYSIIPSQNFKGPSKKFYRPKTCKIWPDFGRLQTSTANISETDEDITNRTKKFSTAIPPALCKKFGELWSTNHGDLVVKSHPPKSTFSSDHISTPRECSAPNFYYAR